jgi:hypothetical protein
MEYLGIKNLLSRFSKKLLDKSEVEENTILIIKDILNIDLNQDNLSFKNKKIILKTRSLIKVQVVLKKEKILTLLKERGFDVEDII